MLPRFLDLINEIETELQPQYWQGAIRWADEKYNGAWSNAIDRFEKAITKGYENLNFQYAQVEADIYKEAILKLLREYKRTIGVSEEESLLDAIKRGSKKNESDRDVPTEGDF